MSDPEPDPDGGRTECATGESERSLLTLAGILDDETAEELRTVIEERRQRRREELESVVRELNG